jgi:hypothetical protein
LVRKKLMRNWASSRVSNTASLSPCWVQKVLLRSKPWVSLEIL